MIDVAVLAGGCSPEHEISLSSAGRVLHHLDRTRWRIWPVHLDRQGRWWPAPRPLASDLPVGPDFRTPGMRPMRPGAALDHLLERGIGVVLPVLHGPFGEDGTVQGMLELHGVPFVGSGCAASAVAMDKVRARECFEGHGVPMPRARCAPLGSPHPAEEAAAIEAEVGLPCFLKVDVSGSTLGVARVTDTREAADFLGEHARWARRYVAEQELVGEEITVGVLGNAGGAVRALPAIGIYPVSDGFFTHSAKYDAGLCEEVIPPRGLDRAARARAAELAVTCHRALWCEGMSRTDMIVTPDGLFVLETNTIPGMTDTSLLPQAAAAAGLDYAALLDHLLELALEAAAQRPKPPSMAAHGAS